MNIILLSGGSGKRLWPLSNDIRSKQFLKLLKNDNDELESMVQRVYRQIREAGIDANIVVATGKSQVDHIKNQLGSKVDIVMEPERRDTFPAIALSSMYLAMEKGMQPDDVVVVLPVDPFADMEYFSTLLQMEKAVKEGVANIVLMGIKPTYPSEIYGYIIPSATKVPVNGATMVDHFREKPNERDAANLIEKGGVWNGGVFAFKLGYIKNIIDKYIKFSSINDVCLRYTSLPKISFDYEVVENEPSIAMVRYEGTWKDLGTWNTLTEVMSENTSGKVIISADCKNTHVLNELDVPIIVLGANNMIVAASPDGILVSDKEQSSQLKPYVETIIQRPMFEERRWGDYKVLGYVSHEDGMQSLTKYIRIKNGDNISYQEHSIRDEVWTVVEGEGLLILEGQERFVARGDVISIPKGKKHAIKAINSLHFVEVQIGEELTESDIKRYEWTWPF